MDFDCEATKCKHNEKGNCLCGASEDQIEQFKGQIEKTGGCWFTPGIVLGPDGRCKFIEIKE